MWSTLEEKRKENATNMTNTYRTAVKQNGFKIWDWNTYSKYWKYKDCRYVNDVIQQLELLEEQERKPVILLHERTSTLRHLKDLLIYLSSHGYALKGIDEEVKPVQF